MSCTCGVDEAGRGPLAGPVVVAAVILDPAQPIDGLADSKALTAARRAQLAEEIRAGSRAWHVAFVSVRTIAARNILHATMDGMRECIDALTPRPELALIDGNRIPPQLGLDCRAIVGGDALEPAISAASILAKTERDRYMTDLDLRYPQYGFGRHKGYGTPEHMAVLKRLGPTPEHRMDFAPVRELLQLDLPFA